LPFALTNAQKRVMKEIRKDLGSGKQMNRLLQGDVGSGKTLVALMSMLIAIDNGYQACIMAPTEILANQHYQTISKLLAGMDIKIHLQTGSSKKSSRKSIAESFSERLGSYSNQSNFSNISELKLYMTTFMQAWANQYIATNKKTAYSGIYQGMTTNAISAEINNFDSTKGAADILVHTQRVSVTGTSSPATAYQDIVITFVKQGSNWLVDNAMWKK